MTKRESIVRILFARKKTAVLFFAATLVLAFAAPFKTYILQCLRS